MKVAIEIGDEKPLGTECIIPVLIDDCNIPQQLAYFRRVFLSEDVMHLVALIRASSQS